MIRRDADILRLDLRGVGALDDDLSLADIETVRLILRGGSPIDWHRLNFDRRSQVDDLLRVNLLDPDDRRDMARLAYLHREALRYLRRNFAFRFPPEVEFPKDVRDLLLYASETGRVNRVQVLSCVVLKAMHTINHLEARELLLETSISEAELITVVEEQVIRRAEHLTGGGLPIVHFYGSRKTRDSMVSKLLSKRTSRAGDILDKLRFRVVTESREDIVPVLSYIVRHVFPWNQVTAGESTNNIIHFKNFLHSSERLRRLIPALQVDIGIEDAEEEEAAADNEFSGASYRMINFIIDVPIRLDHIMSRAGDPWQLQKGSIVYVACEFQVLDQETAYLNEQGENSHNRYKARQKDRVGHRLMWGLLRENGKDGKRSRTNPITRKPRSRSALEPRTGFDIPAIGRRQARPPRPVDLGDTVADEPAPRG